MKSFSPSAIAAKEAERLAAFAEEDARLKAERDAMFHARGSRGATATVSPVERAQAAFEHGDQLFQCAIDVMNQQAVIVAMIGSATNKTSTDPSDILNAVCGQGWELVNGSFVFVTEGEQSRDKFLASGQNVAVKGRTVGYYLFRRATRGSDKSVTP